MTYRTPLVAGEAIASFQQIQITVAPDADLSELLSFLDFGQIKVNFTYVEETRYYVLVDHPPGIVVHIADSDTPAEVDIDTSGYNRLNLTRGSKESVILTINDQFSIEQLETLKTQPIIVKRLDHDRFIFAATSDWYVDRSEKVKPKFVSDPFNVPTGITELIERASEEVTQDNYKQIECRAISAQQAISWYLKRQLPLNINEELHLALLKVKSVKGITQTFKDKEKLTSIVSMLKVVQQEVDSKTFSVIKRRIENGDFDKADNSPTLLSPETMSCFPVVRSILEGSAGLKEIPTRQCNKCGGVPVLRNIADKKAPSKWAVICRKCEATIAPEKQQRNPQGALIEWNVICTPKPLDKMVSVFDLGERGKKEIIAYMHEFSNCLTALKAKSEADFKQRAISRDAMNKSHNDIGLMRNWVRYVTYQARQIPS